MGCIFAEVATKDALFKGDSEIDQIFRIFRTMGTPTEETWPGVTSLPEYQKKNFPAWRGDKLCEGEKISKALDANGLHLFKVWFFQSGFVKP